MAVQISLPDDVIRNILIGAGTHLMPVAQRAPIPEQLATNAQPPVMPSLFGEGYGIYRTSRSAFVFSYLLNLLVAGLLIWSGHWVVVHHQQIKQQVMGLVTDVSPYVLPSSKTQAGGGGGGGGGGACRFTVVEEEAMSGGLRSSPTLQVTVIVPG